MTVKKILKSIGPGFITGASDDDPSGIATYSQTGAQFGFLQAWTAPFSFPFMVAVQEMCGRIGLVTGQGLAGVMKKYYTKPLLYAAVMLLLIANTINIGADLGAMAAAAQLLFGLPFIFWLVGMVALTLTLEIFVSYQTYARYLKYLTFTLLSYAASAFFMHVNWLEVLRATIIPHIVFTKEYLFNIVAILGTTISPYLFFWQANEEVEEEIVHHKLRQMGAGLPKVFPKDIARLRMDTIIGMFFSNLVMFFIIVTAGGTLFPSGISTIGNAADAAAALKPIAGEGAFLLFSLGIIGTGLLAVPILAGSASYAIAEALGWKAGLYLKLRQAHGFYGVITIATLFGILINFIGIDPMTALYSTAIINGIIAPPLLVLILLIANNKNIMGKQTNGWLANSIGITITAIMGACALILLSTLITK